MGPLSLTAIAAPHNGTTFIESNSDFTKFAADLDHGRRQGTGPCHRSGACTTSSSTSSASARTTTRHLPRRLTVLQIRFLSHNDNAFLDLTIDKSLEIKGIEIQPNALLDAERHFGRLA